MNDLPKIKHSDTASFANSQYLSSEHERCLSLSCIRRDGANITKKGTIFYDEVYVETPLL